jgi:hypothetical protein
MAKDEFAFIFGFALDPSGLDTFLLQSQITASDPLDFSLPQT